ncbi:hypothetical protein PR202_ga16350 [Eleusine coracana subsp. coracana]|uniref:Uncharacterized protein n=1 Tax=Eleusine coracana subsp. coracana TaxID=191504 RepID=A0AAV5CLB1_ELECO|nr:hypothetical protein PR202_ga16350 [Eleusine coracana subsp. coracana]
MKKETRTLSSPSNLSKRRRSKTLTKDLAKVNESSELCTSTSKKYQEKCNSLLEENKALVKAIEDLKTRSRSLMKKLESSQASTSKGCGRCQNIDVDMIAKQDAIIKSYPIKSRNLRRKLK